MLSLFVCVCVCAQLAGIIAYKKWEKESKIDVEKQYQAQTSIGKVMEFIDFLVQCKES